MKYMGSKRRIANQIASHINGIAQLNGITEYYEPFCGGCSVAEVVNVKNRHCSDINRYIVALLEFVASGEFSKLEPREIKEDEWRDIKAHVDEPIGQTKYPDWLTCYAGVFCSYRARWFEGYFREYTDKASGQSRTNESGWRNLASEKELLRGIEFKCRSYEELSPNEIKGAIIYCDSPYASTHGYSAHEDGDGMDFEKYYKWLVNMSKNNVVLISEYFMPADRFEEIDSWEMTGGVGAGRSDLAYKPIERLYTVKGGWLFDQLTEEAEADDF